MRWEMRRISPRQRDLLYSAASSAGRYAIVAAPYAIVLALALGGLVWIGCNLANSYPSEAAPHGWPGPSNFDGGVATIRPQLILASTLPPLLWALSTTRRLRLSFDGPSRAATLFVADIALIGASVFLGTVLGRAGAFKTSNEAFWAFFTAHFLLASTFYALAALSGVSLRKLPAMPVGALWVLYAALYESWVRWHTLREAGLEGLRSGALPAWFYTAQALSPLSIYRALLIMWHPQFRDYEERAVLGTAALPGWMNPAFLGWSFAFLWVIVPLEAAWIVWTLRARRRPELKRREEQEPGRPVSGTPLATRDATEAKSL